MARMRSVKPEFWIDRKLARMLSRDARLLYIGLWNYADEHSRLMGDPRYIKGSVFPYDEDLDLAAIEVLLAELEASARVVRYEVDGDPYLFLPYLAKHQRLQPYKVLSRLPEPPESAGQEPSDVPPELGTHSSEPGTDSCERGTHPSALKHVAGSREHVAGSKKHGASREDAPDAEGFEEWFAAYPRHNAKGDARKAWPALARKHGAPFLIEQAKRWADLWETEGREEQHIPYPATWLRGERWMDDPPKPRLRAVSGGYQPFRNPISDDDYDKPIR